MLRTLPESRPYALTVILLLAVALLSTSVAHTADLQWTPYDRPAQYSIVVDKEVPIMMRDGVVLYSDVSRPNAPGRFPVLVTMTPYSKAIAGEAPSYLIERGYVHVAVDVRGQGSSGGTWCNRCEIEQMDGYEVVQWAAAQPWSDGNVGMYGSSYRAINQMLTAALQPPALKALFPIASSTDDYRDFGRTGGDANFAFIPTWLALVMAAEAIPPGWAADDPIQYVLNDIQHAGALTTSTLPTIIKLWGQQTYDENRVASPWYKLDRIKVPTFLVGGWRDLFVRGETLNFERLRALKVPVKLLMVDGNHTETSGGELLPDGAVPGLQQIALRWFDYYLKGLNSRPDLIPPVTVKLKGDGRMETMTQWPRTDIKAKRLYLRGGHRLSTVAPSALEPEEQFAQVYLFGYCSGTSERFILLAGVIPPECATDNTFNEQTELVYTTPIFEADVKLAGPIAANMWIKTTRNEAILSVRVTDVHPDGSSEELSFGLLAASFRAVDTTLSRFINGENIQPWHPFSRDSVQAVTPDQPMLLEIEVYSTNAVIKAGHRLRVSVGPSNFPSYLPPVPQIENSLGGVLTLMHDPQHPSHIVLPIVPPTTWPPLW
ncbi:MAG: peptidase S15 [Candidatus Rokuibacteriota bacterium]|nr:MAG: peptidase S15 [Candidatus Rokubacteria bacterium]